MSSSRQDVIESEPGVYSSEFPSQAFDHETRRYQTTMSLSTLSGRFRGRQTQFHIELVYGLLFIAGFGYLVFRVDPRVAAFEGGLVIGYLLRIWEKMSIYERILEETISQEAEQQVEAEVEEQVGDEVETEVEEQVGVEVEEQVADEVEQQVGEEVSESLEEEVEEQVEAEVGDLDEQIDERVTEQLEEADEHRSDRADDSTA